MLCVLGLAHDSLLYYGRNSPKAETLLMRGSKGPRFLFVGQINKSPKGRVRGVVAISMMSHHATIPNCCLHTI